MKKTAFLTIITVILMVIQSCTKDENPKSPVSAASVTITTNVDENGNQIVTITPNEQSAKVDYALATDGSIEKFENGEMGIMTSEGNSPVEIEVSELEARTYYTIVAKAYDNAGIGSPTAMIIVSTYPDDINIESSYITESSAGFTIYATSNLTDITYYLGNESDRETFFNGEDTYDEIVESILEFQGANYFGLESGKEYIFFVKAKDRNGIPVKKEFAFSTYSSSDECPSVKYEIVSSDTYRTTYRLTGNDKTLRTAAFPHMLDLDATSTQVLYGSGNGRGNLKYVFNSWLSINFNLKQSESNAPFEFSIDNTAFTNDAAVDLYLVAIDSNGEIASIYKENITVAQFDENAGDATCEIEIKNITSSGATYTFTPGANTMAVFYETVEGDWFDDFSQTSDYNEFYMHNRFFNGEGYFIYGKESFEMKEESATPDTKYYAMACPMNDNGLKGWGKLEMKEYRTAK